ncbi:FG-GAP repeat domain-containing protein, partial [Planomonospora venezuelensis]
MKPIKHPAWRRAVTVLLAMATALVLGTSLRAVSPPALSAQSSYTFAGTTDWNNDGNEDIIARDINGALWLYRGQGTLTPSLLPRTQIGTGWNGYTFAGTTDWNNDGNEDIIARDINGALWLYRGQGTLTPSLLPRTQIGTGWNGYTFAGTTDWNNDGNEDIIARDINGALWLYRGQGTLTPSLLPRTQIGTGWNGYTFAGTTDWNNDGNEDIIARDIN